MIYGRISLYGGKNMKTLTIAVPCYNSQDYMRRAIEPLLICENDIEILIIDDGSRIRQER